MNWHSKSVMNGSLVEASTNSITMSWYQPGWLSGHLPQQELEFFLSIPLSTTVGTNLPQSKPVDWQRREILKWESFYPSVRRLYLRSIDFQCFLGVEVQGWLLRFYLLGYSTGKAKKQRKKTTRFLFSFERVTVRK